MKLESHLPKQSFWLYLGPVLNVLTLLLVFFLLGSNFVIQSGVDVRLPESASRLTGFDRARVITVAASGDQIFYFDGEPDTLEGLKKRLMKAKREMTNSNLANHRVIIHADAMAPFGRVLQASNTALALGFEVAYATQPSNDGTGP